MWESISANIISSIGISFCTNHVDKQRRNRFQQKLRRIVNNNFDQYADTSLDQNETRTQRRDYGRGYT